MSDCARFATFARKSCTFRPAFQRVICHAGKRAKQKLAALDLKAGEFASVMYMDTTWKGLFAKFFAAIAREGNYLFCLEPVKKESAAAVQPHLRRLAEVCHNLRLIVTDMALGFEKAIPGFSGASSTCFATTTC